MKHGSSPGVTMKAVTLIPKSLSCLSNGWIASLETKATFGPLGQEDTMRFSIDSISQDHFTALACPSPQHYSYLSIGRLKNTRRIVPLTDGAFFYPDIYLRQKIGDVSTP